MLLAARKANPSPRYFCVLAVTTFMFTHYNSSIEHDSASAVVLPFNEVEDHYRAN
jgi:hypothetical protein